MFDVVLYLDLYIYLIAIRGTKSCIYCKKIFSSKKTMNNFLFYSNLHNFQQVCYNLAERYRQMLNNK